MTPVKGATVSQNYFKEINEHKLLNFSQCCAQGYRLSIKFNSHLQIVQVTSATHSSFKVKYFVLSYLFAMRA